MDGIVLGVVYSETVGTVYFDNIYFWNDRLWIHQQH